MTRSQEAGPLPRLLGLGTEMPPVAGAREDPVPGRRMRDPEPRLRDPR
jgi:hypothetical protein